MVKVDKYDQPDELYYHKDHSWMKVEGDKVRVGIDDFGQQAAGKILFVRLRAPGKEVKQGKSIGSIESGKWVGSIKSPVNGTIVEINEKLKNNPSLLNSSPYDEGWMVVIEPSNLDQDLKELISGPDQIKTWIESEIKERLK
ncbi:MAG: glycine cleavage system protein GcvH [Candidatus Ranarchaeia archaeon]